MKYTIPIDKENMAAARSTINVSHKSTKNICKKINNKKYKMKYGP